MCMYCVYLRTHSQVADAERDSLAGGGTRRAQIAGKIAADNGAVESTHP
jgi:hypothetical protein